MRVKSAEQKRKKEEERRERERERGARRLLDFRFFKIGEADSRNFWVLVSSLPKPLFASSKVFFCAHSGPSPWAPCFF
jgi:hypothetical protein